MFDNKKEIPAVVRCTFDNVIERIETDGIAMPDKSVALLVTTNEHAYINLYWESFKWYVETCTGKWTAVLINESFNDEYVVIFKPSIMAKIRKFLNGIFCPVNNSGLQPVVPRVASLSEKTFLK